MKLNQPAMPYFKEIPGEKLDDVITIFHPGISTREYAAIHLCVPDSGNDELDAMIRRAQRERLAGQMLASLVGGGNWRVGVKKNKVATSPEDFSIVAKEIADALIAAGEVWK